MTTTTVTTIATSGFAASFGLVAVLCLIAFLIAKELLDASADGGASMPLGWDAAMSRALTVPIVPLLLVFAVIVIVKILEVL